ncbi:MAG: ABC transporter [Zetaproteobacteria bacterium]|nr:ABC transporter [Pseudobdellovibrionaceae bacterium]
MSALVIENLNKTYSNGRKALVDISLSIDKGDFYAVLGANGAGKSTLIGIVTSLVNKSSGRVSVFGFDLDRQVDDVKKSIGLVPQEFNFNIFERVQHILENQAGYYGVPPEESREKIERYLKLLGLWEYRNEMARNLSGGYKRRLMIVRALVHSPKLLILDEPTAGVDVQLRKNIWSFLEELNKEGMTIILTSHYLEEVEYLCKNVAIINRGEIALKSSIKNLNHYLPTKTYIFSVDHSIDTKKIKEHDNDFHLKSIDRGTFEVTLSSKVSLNDVFSYLEEEKIKITNVKEKGNFVENVFVKLTKGDHAK